MRAAITARRSDLELPRPQHDVGDAGFVLQRDEDRIALAGALAHQHHARHAYIGAHRARCGGFRRSSPSWPNSGRSSAIGCAFSDRPHLVIRRHMLAQAHGRQQLASGSSPSSRPRAAANSGSGSSSGRRRTAHSALAAIQPERAEGVGIGQQPHRALRQPGAAHQRPPPR
jgi:hypothetical protein